jgi:prevent-host-death family protein
MKTFNIHEAKTHLSRLVDEAANGEPFIIAKAGKPMVKVISLEQDPKAKLRRLDFLKGEQFVIPDNFDEFARDEIEQMFGLKE